MARKLRGSNKVQGGRVLDEEIVPIDPKWVRVGDDSTFVKPSLGVADVTQVTISMGFRIPADFLNNQELVLTNLTGTGVGFAVQYIANISGPGSNNLIVVTAYPNDGSPKELSFVSTDMPSRGNPHHLFASFDTNHAAGLRLRNLYIDGVDAQASHTDFGSAFAIPILGSSIGIPRVDNAPPGGPLNDDSGAVSAVEYSNIQIWTGLCIDPAGISTGKKTWNPATVLRTGNPTVMKELVDWANRENFDPLIVLTFAGVESIFASRRFMTDSKTYRGVFQFSQAEMDYAIGPGYALMDNSNQAATWRWFFTNNATTGAQLPWSPPVFSRGLTDDTGLYRYLMHNQGPTGGPRILDAIDLNGGTAAIGTMRPDIAANMLGQTGWAHGMNRSTSIGTWWAALQAYFTDFRNQAADMLMDATGVPNIEFFYKDGLIRLPSVAQTQFGVADVLLWGTKADFITGSVAHNDGLIGDFTVVNPSGVTDVA